MKKLAIIGFGPRGLSALESLFIYTLQHKHAMNFSVTIFETTNQLGSGNVWDINQPKINLLNISERGLEALSGRPKLDFDAFTIPEFPSFTKWRKNQTYQPKHNNDSFPPRKFLGAYLNQRAVSILDILKAQNIITIKHATITAIENSDNMLTVTDHEKNTLAFDEVLLTIGHQPTEIDSDLLKFKTHDFSNAFSCFLTPYPVENIIASQQENKNVALRGMGLAMLDVLRGLTMAKGGTFKIEDETTFKCSFIPNKNTPKEIIIYSLDGLHMAPKPLNKAIDAQFEISDNQATYFKNETQKIADGNTDATDATFLKELVAKIVSEVYLKINHRYAPEITDKNSIENVIINWLTDNTYEHELIENVNNAPNVVISNLVNMACGKHPISLDYCIGQTWRFCEPILYKTFSHAKTHETVIAAVIALDEKLKRYAYGPPVESLQQLLAVYNSGVLNLNFCNNPKIEITADGVKFTANDESITIQTVINSVISAPKVNEVTSQIIQNLLVNDIIKPIHSKLGIHTRKDGTIVTDTAEKNTNLSVLGRLSKGSVIGVDAILECFGTRIDDWAQGFLSRMEN